MKLFNLAALAAGCFVALIGAAFAATPAVAPVAVAIPVGKWLAAALTFWTFAITGLIVWAAKRYIPPAWNWLVSPAMIENAVHYALATIENEVAGETVKPENVNAIVSAAINWLVANEPAFAKWAGSTLRPRIVAWMSAEAILPAETKIHPGASQTSGIMYPATQAGAPDATPKGV